MTIEKMYGSYSDADLNDWERFPMNANVLTSSAFGAWLLRRDERRDKAIPKDQYEARLKADMVAMFTEIQLEIEELDSRAGYDGNGMPTFSTDYIRKKKVNELIQEKINKLQENKQL